MPDLEMREYFLDESFTSQTMSLPGQIPDNPAQELALTALLDDYSLDESDRAVDSLVNEISEDIKDRFQTLFETAEEVSRHAKWAAFSSWRPYIQSDGYQKLLTFCRDQGQAVWPLLFQQLDSDNPVFAGGLVLDTTLPEYLYYFGKTAEANAGNPDVLTYIKELLALPREGE